MFDSRRRTFLKILGSQITLGSLAPFALAAGPNTSAERAIEKQIPSSGERLNVIGMGTWQTFNVGSDRSLRNARTRVLKTFFNRGGQMIDSSPMYGSSQDVLGYGLAKLDFPSRLFSADKIWTGNGDKTREDMEESLAKWNLNKFKLIQVHNLLNWEAHLPVLQEMKKQGKVRYIGITTSHGRRHRELENIMRTETIDFVQLTYNMEHREVEKRLLPLAQDKGIAVIANRPFDGGPLVDRMKASNAPIPDWVREFDVSNWPQYLLKFIVSHPAITCAIPATTKVVHMKENMGAALGKLPDQQARKEMLDYLQKI